MFVRDDHETKFTFTIIMTVFCCNICCNFFFSLHKHLKALLWAIAKQHVEVNNIGVWPLPVSMLAQARLTKKEGIKIGLYLGVSIVIVN